jgi:hypothetical protein
MAFEIPYHSLKFEGKSPAYLFPSRTSDTYKIKDVMRHLKTYLEAGNKIWVEFTQGARKGTIGRIDIKAEEVTDFYQVVRTGRGEELEMSKKVWDIVFDDRDNVIKVEYQGWQSFWPKGVVLRFDLEGTTWAYTTKAKPEVEAKKLYDHFGVLLEVGQLVIFPEGRKGDVHTRFGYITNITPKGTIKVESIKTRQGHAKTEENISPTIYPSDLVVIDGTDIKDKVTLAKLTNG